MIAIALNAIMLACMFLGLFAVRVENVAPDDLASVTQADRTLVEAISTRDTTKANALLDEQMTWIDRQGKRRGKIEVIHDFATLVTGQEVDVEVHNYGTVVVITGVRQGATKTEAVFLRVWAKGSTGWRVFAYHETPVPSNLHSLTLEPASATGVEGDSKCENPCKSIPYKPKTQDQKDIISAWLRMEVAAIVTNDADQWASTVLDGISFFDISSPQPKRIAMKPFRMAQINDNKKTNAVMPVEPVESVDIWTFGDAGVMVMLQPVGGRPIYWTRVWVKRDGRFQMVASYWTQIAPPTVP